MPTLAIIDYGMGNLASLAKAFVHVAPAFNVVISSDPKVVQRADRVVLPGQSAMPDSMAALRASGLEAAALAAAKSKPFFGVCLGLQMLFDTSDEGPADCLSILPGAVLRFPSGLVDSDGHRLKVPHMGWNEVAWSRGHPVLAGIEAGAWFYFAHSYFVAPKDQKDTLGCTNYPESFTCAVARDNILAVQFHPEKSAAAGLQLLANFCQWSPSL